MFRNILLHLSWHCGVARVALRDGQMGAVAWQMQCFWTPARSVERIMPS